MKNRIVSLLFFLVTGTVCFAQPHSPNELASFITKKADSLFKTTTLPGIFIGVLDNGQRHYYSIGYADPDNKISFDSATLFEAGSITKTFTAYILSSILKEKRIDENTPIVNYLPDSVKANKSLGQITFRHLLNHTSGLPRLPTNLDLSSTQPYENYNLNHLFSFLRKVNPRSPGQFEYSNLGFGLAGVLAGLISKKSYARLREELIFLPFRMLKRGERIDAAARKSKGYYNDKAIDYWKFDALAPAGDLKCTAAEMLTYLRQIATPSKSSKAITVALLQPSFTLSPSTEIGRAWWIDKKEGRPAIYWHNGSTYGFSTYAAFLKDQQKAVIVVVNKFNSNVISDLLGRMIMEHMCYSK